MSVVMNGWQCRNIYYVGTVAKKCALNRRNCSKNKRKTTDSFINELIYLNPNIIVIGEYLNARTPIQCECSICHYKWSPRPTNLLSGCGCPKCGDYLKHHKQVKSKTDFVNAMKIVNPIIKISGEYKNTHTAVKCKCGYCGFIWYATPNNLLRGTGCPKHNASHGENTIMRWLDEHSKPYIHQKRFINLVGVGGRKLPYDFFIPEINTIIEYQGNFHDKTDRLQTEDDYKIRVEHDLLKKNYAIENGIKFVEIWYYDSIEEKLQEIFDITNPVTTIVT